MILPVGISSRAEADLTRQYEWYLDKANVEVAERYLAAFDATVAKLARQPAIGIVRKFRSPDLAGMRSFSFGGRFAVHLIFYRQSGDALTVERVMHGARDLPRRLLEPPHVYTQRHK